MDHRARRRSTQGGPVLWICADELYPALHRVTGRGRTAPGAAAYRDGGERWLVDGRPTRQGNRIGVVVTCRDAAVPDDARGAGRRGGEPLVPASCSAWAATTAARSTSGCSPAGELVLQLHAADVEHHHGAIGTRRPGRGRGRSSGSATSPTSTTSSPGPRELGAPVVRAPHRNPPERGQRALAPRALDLRPRRLHGRGRQPGRRGLRAGLSTARRGQRRRAGWLLARIGISSRFGVEGGERRHRACWPRRG